MVDMAQVLVVLTDTPDGGCRVTAEFIPPLPERLSGEAPSPAQKVAVALVTVLEEQYKATEVRSG
jgi:hypothetical protein